MNLLQLSEALKNVMADCHKTDANTEIIRETILHWCCVTLLDWEECIELMQEFCTTGNLSLSNKNMK